MSDFARFLSERDLSTLLLIRVTQSSNYVWRNQILSSFAWF